MANVALIIQARMGSTRLPGKVMEMINKKTVLEHLLGRARRIEGVDHICCAIPDSEANYPIGSLSLKNGAQICLGSEKDVLMRYYKAANMCGADVIMRITSDCPILDPMIASQALQLFFDENADFATNNMPASWPHGLDLEICTFDLLEDAALSAEEPDEREHVMPYIRKRDDIKKVNLPCPEGNLHHHRWTLDYPEDLTFLRALAEKMPENFETAGYGDFLKILEEFPELSDLNKEHAQNVTV